VGLLGLICIRAVVVSDRLARQFGDRTEGTLMPIDPSMLAKSIGILTDLDPQRDLAKALQDVVVAAKQLFDVDAAGVMLADADGQLRWAAPPTSWPRPSRTIKRSSARVPAWTPSPTPGRRPCMTPVPKVSGGRSPWSWPTSGSARG